MRSKAMILSLSALLAMVPPALGDAPSFSRDIRPILAENCFHCHGPDSRARKANLRLDNYAGATEGGEFSDPIVPGKPDESEVIARIHATDPDEIMPPPESKRVLTDEQKQLLSDWIAAGAKYEDHWAWRAPVRPEVPAVQDEEQVANPIDAYLLRRLEAEGMTFSEPASPANVLRRLSLDLIGLPPAPGEVRDFEKAWALDRDASLSAAVDRLLGSPRFGERWARPWLDLARYADSNGFQADQLRPSWAYRDWVIDALNANMPYDRFTIEQLAGDLLPRATVAQRVATGFHRTVTCNVEAGVSPEGNRVNQVFDRVNTTATVWLGLTMECAQCHDHKYDPFSMEDYYSLFAFFNNTPLEVQLPSNKTDVSHDFIGPYLDLPLNPAQEKRANELDTRITAATASRDQLLESLEPGFAEWEQLAVAAAAQPPNDQPLEVVNFSSSGVGGHVARDDGSILLTGEVPPTATYTVELKGSLEKVTGFRLETLTHPDLPGRGPGRGDPQRPNFVLHEFKASLKTDGKVVELPLKDANADFSQSGWHVTGAIDGDTKTGWAINPQFHKPHWATFALGNPIPAHEDGTLVFTLVQNFGKGRVIGNLRISALTSETGSPPLPSDILTILKKPGEKRNAKQQARLKAHFYQSNAELRTLEEELTGLKKERGGIQPDRSLVMVEMETPRPTRILKRGNFLAPDREVRANTPEVLPSLDASGRDAGQPRNRLDLARWLVRRDHPLTARVAVNRWWAELLGNGIVATLEDFGTQSEPPTHPDLLDWLAVEFMESGWDMKHVLRTIVTSNAYLQSSRLKPAHLEKDPRNLLLARAPRFRMDAERLRDNALAVSGLLSTTMHGKPVMPYQPPGLWRQTGRNEPKWEEQKDENRWRRGIYIVYRRAAPYPSMVNFDAPDRAACTVRRPRTNTPTQALTMLNDPAYVEMSLALADRVLSEIDSPSTRINHAFRLVLSRAPSARESKVIDELLGERLHHYRDHPEAARELLSNPRIIYRPKHENISELASWFFVANALLNLDETMTRN